MQTTNKLSQYRKTSKVSTAISATAKRKKRQYINASALLLTLNSLQVVK